jgi:hypothetical protein
MPPRHGPPSPDEIEVERVKRLIFVQGSWQEAPLCFSGWSDAANLCIHLSLERPATPAELDALAALVGDVTLEITVGPQPRPA